MIFCHLFFLTESNFCNDQHNSNYLGEMFDKSLLLFLTRTSVVTYKPSSVVDIEWMDGWLWLRKHKNYFIQTNKSVLFVIVLSSLMKNTIVLNWLSAKGLWSLKRSSWNFTVETYWLKNSLDRSHTYAIASMYTKYCDNFWHAENDWESEKAHQICLC